MDASDKRKLVEVLCDHRESAPSAVHLVWSYHFDNEPPFEPYDIGLEGYLDSIRDTVIQAMSEAQLDSIITMYQTEYPEDWTGTVFTPKD